MLTNGAHLPLAFPFIFIRWTPLVIYERTDSNRDVRRHLRHLRARARRVASAKARAVSRPPSPSRRGAPSRAPPLAMGSKVSSKARAAGLVVRAADDKPVPGSEAKGMGKALPMEMDIDAIMKLLPHRYPFLLVDRVLEIEQGSYAIGLKNVTINDNFFPGHFPQRPIMPGVLMVEAMAQVGGLIKADRRIGRRRNPAGVLLRRHRRRQVPQWVRRPGRPARDEGGPHQDEQALRHRQDEGSASSARISRARRSSPALGSL